jgi:glutamate-1-semialdehyde 2,1-aminomutase
MIFSQYEIAHQIAHAGSMFGFFFTNHPVIDLRSAKTADTALYARFFHATLENGVYFAPAQFEAGFLSCAHTDESVDAALEAVRRAARTLTSKDPSAGTP